MSPPCNPALIVLGTNELLAHILGPNGFPPSSRKLTSPNRMPRSIGFPGLWFITECFIHPDDFLHYRCWIATCSRLCCVSKQLHDLVTPHLLQELWMEHPSRFKDFINGYTCSPAYQYPCYSGYRRSQFALVRSLRVTWAMCVWDDWDDYQYDIHPDLRTLADWPHGIDAVPMGFSVSPPIRHTSLWSQVMLTYEEMMSTFHGLSNFDGGFTGISSLIYMPTPPGTLSLLATKRPSLRSLRINTHAHHQELFETLRVLEYLEELTLNVFTGDGHSGPPIDTTVKLPHLELLFVIFHCPESPLLGVIQEWTLPQLDFLVIRFADAAPGDLAGLLSQHGQYLRHLELGAMWHADDPPIDLTESCPRLMTLSIDWDITPPALIPHPNIIHIFLHHSSGCIRRLKKDPDFEANTDVTQQILWPFDHFLYDLEWNKWQWAKLIRVTDSSCYHPCTFLQRESFIRWSTVWIKRLDECGITCFDAYGRKMRDITLTVSPQDDHRFRPTALEFGPQTRGW
ncbi:hypothetical protein M422DRAFT_783889 [Sphaerobolus stellatus SS14]|uniref:Uncharacterized protein n=1 Tax=Sphaerobolus stellatus (strain SS14) TaxID=990650 RepID=A0A0C9V075_SPHS4|nr:hypothetical protein M422DRAFT_783889 [Sphaerobolus stellatus SS14]